MKNHWLVTSWLQTEDIPEDCVWIAFFFSIKKYMVKIKFWGAFSQRYLSTTFKLSISSWMQIDVDVYKRPPFSLYWNKKNIICVLNVVYHNVYVFSWYLNFSFWDGRVHVVFYNANYDMKFYMYLYI